MFYRKIDIMMFVHLKEKTYWNVFNSLLTQEEKRLFFILGYSPTFPTFVFELLKNSIDDFENLVSLKTGASDFINFLSTTNTEKMTDDELALCCINIVIDILNKSPKKIID